MNKSSAQRLCAQCSAQGLGHFKKLLPIAEKAQPEGIEGTQKRQHQHRHAHSTRKIIVEQKPEL
jgi:hypothetical protein